jgi:glycosyltransferase involved in cell wall biosynthesis
VVGVGPELSALQILARDLGVDSKVDFLGAVPHKRVLALFRDHDVFLFPSLHDSGGIAVLEAMYLGLPVVCLDLGGPAVSVGDAGIKVPCHNARQVVEGLADAVRRLLSDVALRKTLVARARARVIEVYDWDSKAQYISDLYESVARH